MDKIPKLNNRFICLVPYTNPQLSAVISSYLSTFGAYLPIFVFPEVTSKFYTPDGKGVNENTLSQLRAIEFVSEVGRAIKRMNSCENLIFAGLSENQKSYLIEFDQLNIIEIESEANVDFLLSTFLEHDRPKIKCQPLQLGQGLAIALKYNFILEIDTQAAKLEILPYENSGLIIVEDISSSYLVLAINYAHSVNANVILVPKLDKDENIHIKNLIEKWTAPVKNMGSYRELKRIITERIKHIPFENFEYATFFTEGVPYSLILENIIPFTYVHLTYRPDNFIINNLLFEGKTGFGTAVVFSPKDFSDDETNHLTTILEEKDYVVRKLFAEKANYFEFDKYTQLYPFTILHICSHGGEVKGTTILQKFKDRDGRDHEVEYDEAIAISGSPLIDTFSIQSKHFFTKFDGHQWKSAALKSQSYPQYIFADMENATNHGNAKNKTIVAEGKTIPNSCYIQCRGSFHQGMFRTIASNTSPFVFNNSCWSAYEIMEHILTNGVRGYIGTLWAVDNDHAVAFSLEFYMQVFSSTIATALHRAHNTLKGTESENIYIFYGLHFATFPTPKKQELDKSHFLTFQLLADTLMKLQREHKKTITQNLKDLIEESLIWLRKEIDENFSLEKAKYLNVEKY